MDNLAALGREIGGCRLCADQSVNPLPHEPRPVVRLSQTARLCISGQAPGTRVHASGIPFNDPSGDRLRDWMGVDRDTFYDTARISIVPMGFCFPGHDSKGGDLPPRRECRATWHDRIFAAMPQLELILVIGQYAQSYHLGNLRRKSLTDTVWAWKDIVEARKNPVFLPLPHPSWRNNAWIRKNPWFSEDTLPYLRSKVAKLIK